MFHLTFTALASMVLLYVATSSSSTLSGGVRDVYNLTYTRLVQVLTEICYDSIQCPDIPVNVSNEQVLLRCFGCSLDPGCGTTNRTRCCYKSDDLTVERRSLENFQCRLPINDPLSSSREAFSKMHHVKTFYMLGERFANASETEVDEDCVQFSVAPWGAFHPVSAKESGIVYYNYRCAEKDGLSTDEYEFWTPRVLCPFKNPDELGSAIEGTIPWPAVCPVYFSAEGIDLRKVESQLCYESYEATCLDMDAIHIVSKFDDLGLQDIIDLCLSGLVVPVQIGMGDRFLSPFCMQCNDRGLCDGGQGTPDDALTFSNLLDPAMFAVPISQEVAALPQACSVVRNGSMNLGCRDIKCSMGKFRIKSGECMFPKTMYIDKLYTVILKLNPRSGYIDIPPGRDTASALVSPIAGIGFDIMVERVYMSLIDVPQGSNTKQVKPTSGGYVEYFIVQVVVLFLRDVTVLTGMFDQLRTAQWLFFGDDGVQPLFPSLSRHTQWEPLSGTELFVPAWYTKGNKPDLPLREQLHKIYENGQFSGSGVNLNKPFLCDRIELYPEEFSLLAEGLVLYIHGTDEYLFDGEFSLTTKPFGETTALVCLPDSGFVPRYSLNKGNSANHLNELTVLAVCYMILL